MLSRRTFIRAAGGVGLGFGLYAYLPALGTVALARVPGGTLDPAGVPKYRNPLLIPPVMPRAATITLPGGKPADYYEISVRQLRQQILPAGLPVTTVWGYGAVKAESTEGLRIHHAPSVTIEATHDRPVRIKWINDLMDAKGNYLPHLLPVDPTLHWANPPGGVSGRDTRPNFAQTPGAYGGPVPMVVHLHGAVGVGDESDGYAEAWYLPTASNVPAGYATEGTWYRFFSSKAQAAYGAVWGPGSAIFQYPNPDRASTKWYHDHTLGMTRLNVYAGPAGFYLLRGGPDGDEAVLDSRNGSVAVLPSPAPREGDKFPSNKTYYEIPVAIQDRAFDGRTDGRLWMDQVTENPGVGDTEIWEIYNTTADAHPMHIHELAFEVVNRQRLVRHEEEVVQPIRLDRNITPPKSWETGVKDTVVALPGQVTRSARSS
jgi:spore coat protein A